MDNNENVLGGTGNSKRQLGIDTTNLMLKGAGYAAIMVLLIWLMIIIIKLVGTSLPEQSRETADPSPWSALEVAPALVVTT